MSKKTQDLINDYWKEVDEAKEELIRAHREWIKVLDEYDPDGEKYRRFVDRSRWEYANDELGRYKAIIKWLRDETRRRTTQDVDLDDMIMDLEDKIRNPKPKRRRNSDFFDTIAKKKQETIDRLGGESEFIKANQEAYQEFDKAFDEFWKIADERWKELWREQRGKTLDKYYNGEIDINEAYKMHTQWLKDAIRQIKKQQIQDVDLDDMIMDLEDKIRNPNPTRKNPTPISVLRLRENNGDDEYWERLYKIRAARDEAQTRWMEWVQTLTPGTGQTMAAMERWFAFNQPKVHPLSDEKLEQMIEETNFFNRDIIENS
jgi:hypothetical protein